MKADTAEGAAHTEPIRVLVVDDHDLFRAGLSSLLASRDETDVVGQASGGRAGVRLAAELRPDVVLMDLRMPDLDGPEAIRMIRERDPDVRVVALTVLTDAAAVAGAMEAGACGFLAKDMPIDAIVSAVQAASQGAAWLSPHAAEIVLRQLRRADHGVEPELIPTKPLSDRELEVLRLVAQGMENSQIAVRLNISQRTAKNHVSNILAKLGLPSRVQAAIYAVRRGLT